MWRLPGCCPAVWLSVSVLGDNVWSRVISAAAVVLGRGRGWSLAILDTAPCEDLSLGSLGCWELHHVAQVP